MASSEYVCARCGNAVEKLQEKDAEKRICPACGSSDLKRQTEASASCHPAG